ncbi:hydroxyacylglutathione hydrolase [Niveibacterium terrae]|uniref:hydroxyacylglutathione hydrolase n=1 Tax=Niveibacterium terrae TaxID=3373598 RepID=UPI003A8F420F
MRIVPLSAFSDNYIWAIVRGERCVLVDPGDATGALRWLADEGLALDAILLTHHHDDHVGGVAELLSRHPGAQVFGPSDHRIPFVTRPLGDGERFVLPGDPVVVFRCLATPGHTVSHIVYLVEDCLFSGDTLFSAGCGRIFEGTPEQMFASLARLAALPDATRIFCAHEYTEANLRFALAVEPDNPAITAKMAACAAQRGRGEPTLPVTLGEERCYNPFLRCREAKVQAAALAHDPATRPGELACFTALRAWKNTF